MRTARRGVPADQRNAAFHLRGLWRTAAQGIPSGRDRVQGIGVLRHGQPIQGQRRVVRGEAGIIVRCEARYEAGCEGGYEGRCEGRGDEGRLETGRREDHHRQRQGEERLRTAEIGVFGGSGFYRFLESSEAVDVDTPYGSPSASPVIGEVGG